MEITIKTKNMSNKKIFSGDAKQYAEWLNDNISEISTICGWGEMHGSFKIKVYAGQGSEVARLTILHTNDYVTEILCEVNQTSIPLAAALKAIFAVEASYKTGQLRSDAKTKRRWVVAAPFIDEVLVQAMQEDRLPIHFLQARPGESESKYWESKITATWEQ